MPDQTTFQDTPELLVKIGASPTRAQISLLAAQCSACHDLLLTAGPAFAAICETLKSARHALHSLRTEEEAAMLVLMAQQVAAGLVSNETEAEDILTGVLADAQAAWDRKLEQVRAEERRRFMALPQVREATKQGVIL
jgi:conjugal transfer/entry exclusion protein